MTYENFLTFMRQIKYDKKYAETQILSGEWRDLVHMIFWNKPYRITYSPRLLTKYTEFIEFLDGNGFRIKPICYIDDYIQVEIEPE